MPAFNAAFFSFFFFLWECSSQRHPGDSFVSRQPMFWSFLRVHRLPLAAALLSQLCSRPHTYAPQSAPACFFSYGSLLGVGVLHFRTSGFLLLHSFWFSSGYSAFHSSLLKKKCLIMPLVDCINTYSVSLVLVLGTSCFVVFFYQM